MTLKGELISYGYPSSEERLNALVERLSDEEIECASELVGTYVVRLWRGCPPVWVCEGVNIDTLCGGILDVETRSFLRRAPSVVIAMCELPHDSARGKLSC